ncbi:hypothetical protein HOLleu_18865 [Holothuria leucospilota]|uniref:Uncharacterized protein n=1 Tax=Holothuria leucospilota TaxID=206669 RepID=A0A9Q1C2F3_HOLLE|nr:hypothetical protein HOLleu_18865 [Holothuria leucospilota]
MDATFCSTDHCIEVRQGSIIDRSDMDYQPNYVWITTFSKLVPNYACLGMGLFEDMMEEKITERRLIVH